MEKVKPYIHWTKVDYTTALVVGSVAIPLAMIVVGACALVVLVLAGSFLFGPEVGTFALVAFTIIVCLVGFGAMGYIMFKTLAEDFRKVNGMGKK